MKSVIFAAAVLLASPLSAATVLNGSFEDTGGAPDVHTGGSWGVYSSIPGWMTGSGPGIEVQRNTIIGAQDGNNYVELDSHSGSDTNSSMYQDIAMTAGTYELSFWYSPRRRNAGTNGIEYSIAGGTGFVTGPGGDYAVGTWTEVVQRFVLAADQTVRLSFTAVGRDDSLGGFVDNVSIAPVPLPASGLLLLAALGGAGYAARRRKS